MRLLLLCVCIIKVSADSGLIRKPNATEIFEPIVSSTDWADVLYLCDFLKTSTFSCNVTVEGVDYLKNSSRKSAMTASIVGAAKLPKFAVLNVIGSWSPSDGIMKQHYATVDYLDIVAKCFFRVEYYECFGVPRCDGHGAMSDCHGGEPWRGQYEGAPNVGFKANVTNVAMESPAMPQGPPSPVSAQQTLVGQNPAADGLSVDSNQVPDTRPDQTVVTLTNSSGTFTSTGSFSGPIEVPANGSLSIVKVSSPSGQNGSSGVQVSSFASFSSGSGSDVVSNGNPFPASAFPGFDFLSPPRRRRPLSGFPRTTDPSAAGSDGSFAGPPAQDAANCSSPGDFGQNLRCLIQNFQSNVLNSMMTSFQFPDYQPLRFNWSPRQRSPFSFSSRQEAQQDQPQMQSQSMGSMFQSQVQQPQQQPLGRSFFSGSGGGMQRFGGFKVMIVPDNAPQFQQDDDMPAWMTSPFRK